MAEMTDAEAEALDELWTRTTPELVRKELSAATTS